MKKRRMSLVVMISMVTCDELKRIETVRKIVTCDQMEGVKVETKLQCRSGGG